jgi:soluble lytic murein transglycosylase
MTTGVGPAGANPSGALEAAMPKLAIVRDDPRLAGAFERDAAGDDAAAAREVERVMAISALDSSQACAWSYVAGRLHLAAGEASEAVAPFERAIAPLPAVGSGDSADAAPDGAGDDAASPACPLAQYARLRAAQALVRAGRYDEALAHARAIAEPFAEHDEAALAVADALVGKGDRAAAVDMWRALLASHPHGLRWVDTSLQLARALVDGTSTTTGRSVVETGGARGPALAQAQEALDLTTRVVVEAPAVAEKLGAGALRAQAASALRARALTPLTLDERLRQAQAWLDATQPKRARDAADALIGSIPKWDKEHGEIACKAAIVRAQATPHGKHDEAAGAWGVAIARCDSDETLPAALYQGARASASASRHAEALARFEQLEKRFPKHRLADDARLRAAAVLEDSGDEARALSMLSTLPDLYPDGDMRSEAMFRVARARLQSRDWDGARTALDRAIALAAEASASGAAGRAEYFRARVAQLAGDVDEAKTRYAALIANRPLSYYMLCAYARLRILDDSFARSTLQASISRESSGPFLTREHAELKTPEFEQFVRLLEVGEIDAARRQAGALRLADEGVDPEVLWSIAWLYNRAGAPELGHAFARARLVDFRAHWPAGRWRVAWEVAYPRPWDAVVVRESESTGVPASLTWAIMREESAFNPDARSSASALGLMQLMGATAKRIARDTALPFDEQALHRPDVSIALGVRLLASLRSAFQSHPALAVAAYNSGTTSVRRWLADYAGDDIDVFVERIPFDETRGYVKRVLASEAAYAYLYAPATLDELLTW